MIIIPIIVEFKVKLYVILEQLYIKSVSAGKIVF